MRYVFAVAALTAALTACSNTASVEFKSCEQAQQAGVMLPLTPGDVGWNPQLDSDHDGRACE